MSWNSYWMTNRIFWVSFCNHDLSPFLPRLLASYSIAGLQNLFQMIFYDISTMPFLSVLKLLAHV